MIKRNAAKVRYRKEPNDGNLHRYKELRNRCNRVCRDAQRRHIHASVSSGKAGMEKKSYLFCYHAPYLKKRIVPTSRRHNDKEKKIGVQTIDAVKYTYDFLAFSYYSSKLTAKLEHPSMVKNSVVIYFNSKSTVMIH
ncbi:hypothetical protein ACJJTC_000325 [Scirpophaga incertulas]